MTAADSRLLAACEEFERACAAVDPRPIQLFAAARGVIAEREALAAKMEELASTPPGMFVCPGCGPRVKADEDGCCAVCGADCAMVAYRSKNEDAVIVERDMLLVERAEFRAELERQIAELTTQLMAQLAERTSLTNQLIAQRDEARAEVEGLRADLATFADGHPGASFLGAFRASLRRLSAAHQTVDAWRPVINLVTRWCNRPESVIRQGSEPFANDVALWRELRRRVAALHVDASGARSTS